VLRDRLRVAATGLSGFSERFLLSEWLNVVDAWGLSTPDAYLRVQRMGVKVGSAPKRTRL
jgi:hypothetical protein